MKALPELRQYIAERVEIDADGCWNWKLATNAQGYGYCFRKGWRGYAHRFAYTELVGPIPKGLQLDHLCRNPGCVNPDHLEAVTGLENMRRGVSARLGRNYGIYLQADKGLWCATGEISGHIPRKRKSFRSVSRDKAVANIEAWLADNR